MNSYLPEGSLISTYKNQELVSTVSGLERALERQIILEAPAVLCDSDFNLHVSLGSGVKGVIPREEVQYTKSEETKDIAILTRVGKSVAFKVMGFRHESDGRITAVLSRRCAQEECISNYIQTLTPGDIIPAKVTHIESFGAFLDIGVGIVSLLSIDSISVSRISHPCERLSVGDSIYAVVKEIDRYGRIFLSQRELFGTWLENAACFCEGDTVKGTVRSIEDYGVFVELTPNLAGLAEYTSRVKTGDVAAVYIKSIIPEKMKIKLIIIDSSGKSCEKEPQRYFIDTSTVSHISSWVYSPKESKKRIESIFT